MENFNDIYAKVYKNSKKELNRMKLKNGLIFLLMILSLISFIFFLVKLCSNVTLTSFILMSVFSFVFLGILVNFDKRFIKYKIQYKEKIIKPFVNGYSEKFEYYPQKGILESEYNRARFDKHYDSYSAEDLIEGIILNDCKIKMSEVHTIIQHESINSEGDTNTYYNTLFHGLFAKIDLNKGYNLDFKVVRNSNSSVRGENKLEMDSGEFERHYDVITNDKISTLRVLTSEIMQMLIDFKMNYKVTPEISLYHYTLYIRFMVGNVFEPNLIKNDMDYDKLKRNYEMIDFIVKITEAITKHILEFEE